MKREHIKRILSVLLCAVLALSHTGVSVLAEETEPAACSHEHTRIEEEAGAAATCTDNGYHTVITMCDDCEAELSRTTEEDGALGHNYQETARTEATYEAEGSVVFACSRCSDTYTETLPMLVSNADGDDDQSADDPQGGDDDQPADDPQNGDDDQPANDPQDGDDDQPANDPQGGEEQPKPFSFQIRLGSVTVSVTGDPGVFGAEGSVSVAATGNGEINQASEKALDVQADERTIIRHRLYAFSAGEMNGSAQVRVNGLSFSELAGEYPDGELSVYLLRWDEGEKKAVRVSADADKQRNSLSFTLSSLGIYDIVTVIRLPQQQEEEQPTDDNNGGDSNGLPGEENDSLEGNEKPQGNENLEGNENPQANEIPEGNENTESNEIPEDNKAPEGSDNAMGTRNAKGVAKAGAGAPENPVVTVEVEGSSKTYVSTDDDGRSNDELLTGYVEKLFSAIGGQQKFTKGTRSTGYTVGGDLTGTDACLYGLMETQILAISATNETSTKISFNPSAIGISEGPWTAEALNITTSVYTIDEVVENGNIVYYLDISPEASTALDAIYAPPSLSKALNALLADYPYELYWYNKSDLTEIINSYTYTINYNQDAPENSTVSVNLTFTISMPVAQEYQNGDAYTVNTAKVTSAQNAVSTIQTLLTNTASLSVQEKLAAFKNKICELVSYNSEAANDPTTPYGDPWQLVYVFDGDENTNVVCEGYSKAFKYLCDQSGISCLLVTGTMQGGTGAGPHMWNLVILDGKSYLVDVTNSDENTVGADGSLFLATRPAGSDWDSYTISSVTYTYSEDTKTTFSQEALTVCVASSNPADTHTVSFAGNGGTGNMAAVTVDSGASYTLPACGFTAPEGKQFAGWLVDEATDPTAVGQAITVTANVTLTAAWEDVSHVMVEGVSTTFGDQFTLNFYLRLPQSVLSDTGAYGAFTSQNASKTVLVKNATTRVENGVTLYRFSFDLVAKEVNNPVTLKMYDGNGTALTMTSTDGTVDYTQDGYTYSLAAYNTALITGDYDEKTKALATAAKDYCEMAQISLNYNAEGLSASSRVTAVSGSTLNQFAATESGSLPEGVTMEGISVMFESDNSLRLYLKFEEGAKAGLTYKVDDHDASLLQRNDGEEYLTATGIVAKYLHSPHTFKVLKNGEVVYTYTASVLSYANILANGDYGNWINMGKALYLYNQAAKAYFNVP